jgi:hypothetical protein
MPRRVPIRLVRLLAIVCACCAPAAAAQAAPPGNDLPSGAQPVANLDWRSLSVFQDIVVPATDWTDASTGPEDALPSCTGSVGFRSIWYQLVVPEAAVLRVTVISSDSVRYQPVVNVLDPEAMEAGCGLANDVKQGATANATAYVHPRPDGTAATYLVRVAEVANNSALGGLPMLTVRFSAQDVTAPHIRVRKTDKVPPGVSVVYDAGDADPTRGTTDGASQVNPASAQWTFLDKRADGTSFPPQIREGMRVSYTWRSSGPRDVVFRVADFAGNESMYRFTTLVRDTVRPEVSFSLQPPQPGARRMRITVRASESVRLRLLVTQVGHKGPLLKSIVRFWGDTTHSRSVPLRGIVGKGLLVVSGIARDLSDNGTALPTCVVDPVTGQGSCTSP